MLRKFIYQDLILRLITSIKYPITYNLLVFLYKVQTKLFNFAFFSHLQHAF